MNLQYRTDKRPRRHDLVFVTRKGWRTALEMRGDLGTDPLIAQWVDNRWPLVGRRAMPGDMHGVPLGLPLPPFAGKRRLAFVMQPEDVVSVAAPLSVSAVSRVGPRTWRPTLERLRALAALHSADARVCGSLAWQALTSLSYVTAESDLDVLFQVCRDTDVGRLTAGIASIEAAAPMRVDGELIREDGAAVNWRELRGGAREVLLKTVAGIGLIGPQSFISGSLLS